MNDAIKTVAQRAAMARASANIVPSPCVAVCRMDDATGLCLGCWRTLDELRQWSEADRSTRLAIWDAVERRAAAGLMDSDAAAAGQSAPCPRQGQADCEQSCENCPGVNA